VVKIKKHKRNTNRKKNKTKKPLINSKQFSLPQDIGTKIMTNKILRKKNREKKLETNSVRWEDVTTARGTYCMVIVS